MKKLKTYLIFALALAVTPLYGDVIYELDYVSGSSGSVNKSGSSYTSPVGDVLVDRNSTNGMGGDTRGYYSFDLSAITEGVLVGATLTLDVSDFTSGASVDLTTFDYDPLGTLRDLYQDIAGGTDLASFNVDDTGIIEINFTAAELTEIMNSFGGLFTFGLLAGSNKDFVSFNDLNAKLTLNVAPEVGEVLLMLM